MEITAVIGMNYGDEGKGHITSYLSDEHTMVVRHNGGAQASHAVAMSDGREHVFHHFGSGSLRGARTLLASHFLVNPLVFLKELEALRKLAPGLREVLIDPRCRVTTPYDMLVNEYGAHRRGRHDTCGLGINETVERSRFGKLRITARDVADMSDGQLRDRLKRIANEWVPWRVEQLGFPRSDFQRWLAARPMLDYEDAFARGARWVVERSVLWDGADAVERFVAKDARRRRVVFEGGQGLLLDQDRDEFAPYLTRSSTGLRNVLEFTNALRSEVELRVYLVTRTYMTRHGDGPMFREVDGLPYPGVTEPTNPDNPYQGRMRYGLLDMGWWDRAIDECLLPGVAEVGVALTCIDQLPAENGSSRQMAAAVSGRVESVSVGDLGSVSLLSSGRTERDVAQVDCVAQRGVRL